MFWVSDHRNNLILFDANGNPQPDSNIKVYDDVHDLTEAHTVNRNGNNRLIYIDTNNQIMHFSNNNTYTLYLENANSVWIYRYVYSSLLSGNLLIGMSNKDSTCSKIAQYTIDSNELGNWYEQFNTTTQEASYMLGPAT